MILHEGIYYPEGYTFTGALHDLAVVVIKQWWSPIFTCAYFVFACLSLLSLKLAPFIMQERWPTIVNVLVNAGIVVGIFEASMRLYWHFSA